MAQLRVTPPGGRTGAGASALGPVRSIGAAQKHFLTQLGPTAYNSAAWDENSRKDCGPTSALMALSVLGLVRHPAADGAATAIRAAREAMHPQGDAAAGTSSEQLQEGVARYGAHLEALRLLPSKLPALIDEALGRGHPVLLEGDPKTVWGQALAEKGDYLESYTRRSSDFDHWIAVLGKTPEGLYLVADPLSKNGPFAVSGKDLVNYVTSTGGELPAWAGELSPSPAK
jgi:hypothetical protein